MASNILETVDSLKDDLDALRPLPPEVLAKVEQKLRIESNYHSNAVEGNSLTLGETRSLILHGLTAHGKPIRDHLDIQGHDDAVKAIESAVNEQQGLNEVFIRNLHRALLKEPYEVEAIAPDGTPCKRLIAIGDYKSMPNNVKTSTGEIYYFTPPEQVKPEMTDLLDWYRAREVAGEHPVIIAATFHYRFVRIHPFDDGNGRMARLLMNLILIKHGYTVAIVQSDKKTRYLQELERADQSEDPTQFIEYIASSCTYALDLYLRAARGESIEGPEDIDREIAVFKRSMTKSLGPDDRVALQHYVETVAHPFYIYFRSKTESLTSGMFAMPFNPYLTFEGTSIDGSVFREEKNGEVHIGAIVVPEYASDITITFNYTLLKFRSTGKGVRVQVENKVNSRDSIWRFRLSGHHSYEQAEHRGHDLDDLKMRFNKLLRHLMDLLKEWRLDVT